ncbi:MAG: hypothetical protein IKU24_01115 [Clostridia bacterium]|nr:hypothetical protein [Clostridia bacterium]
MKKRKNEEKQKFILPFREEKVTGKFQNVSCVTFAISLPTLNWDAFEETKDYFQSLKENFLAFLEEKSKEEQTEVMFGGISYQAEGEKVTLSTAFSPFRERIFFPFATLFFSDGGKLYKIVHTKR